jgi:hypothetical protein
MTAKSRYWDHETCAWVTYESPSLASPEALDEALPEQRIDEEAAPAAARLATS